MVVDDSREVFALAAVHLVHVAQGAGFMASGTIVAA